ncbi:undecaprenyl/decaprenyl-phosphate alpha-N-acetylglucosaminyl 1-phosphate transferase [Clostridium tagluense]|uniref:glycosyltransferase family 4 protein n=1 Tax=Clostridium tagluense TaxID=360422 RepID=UPI001C0CC168|nr:MraY family glycosyltransferase [Clostridium tagluense]MBU3127366.1 undecaprenyl/decaprenyl-phosphate alpha-N-acetylglucosaminyl 1-phosphate transferase [Clostridium tagluense]MCB2311160.1 undecaprenyl/decaprenyl-phosphate alpha-N-acetylglucosaminyl 1-phosphate transferase [Clostridium tagluense]MCB2315884.1 undecaprenyl/decaprenyl-phosphate alpha-N-acetylglucosaminyl 1-phosphate transferase [Clostridium tagluense]MCB2320769.1 undecaprenyl/decaprenyl-phosphate alpha-N-acetylglucosaminyl 1-ph
MSKIYILAIITALISFIITPLVKRFAILVNAIDIPKDERRVHKKPVPIMGGLAIYISFVIGAILYNGILTSYQLGIIVGATIIVMGGMIDDIKELSPKYKLLIQIMAAVCLLMSGVKISILTNPFREFYPYLNIGWASIPVTIIWIVGVTNAFNLIDGLDGLAAGIAFIACVTLMIVSIISGRLEAAFLTAVLSGAILGFLPYNFNPASIFMGDTGSQLLGFLLAAISIQCAIKSATAFVIAVPILAFALPIYDTLFAMIRRKANGKSIMQADKGHLHHRLLDMGLSQKQAVIIMYFISAVLGGIAIIAMQMSNQRAYFLLGLTAVITVSAAWKYGIFQHKE